MRSVISRWLAVAAWSLVLAAGPLGATAPAPGDAPSRKDVQAAVQVIQADPNVGGTHLQKSLRFKKGDEKKSEPRDLSTLRWLIELFEWIARTARVLVWVLGAVAVALLLVGVRRWVRARGQEQVGPRPVLPSHVRNLDIRPESLPDAVGAAAAALWADGQHLPALSLLYRGALSRLVHVHAVPIRAASTEDECAALARTRMEAAPADFVAALVAAWQLAVYGARLPDVDRVLALCRDFDLQLGRVQVTPNVRNSSTAPVMTTKPTKASP